MLPRTTRRPADLRVRSTRRGHTASQSPTARPAPCPVARAARAGALPRGVLPKQAPGPADKERA
jgi:hypothetical protein